MTPRKNKFPWRYYVDEHENVVWCVVHNYMSAMAACVQLKKMHPGYECHYCTDAFLDVIDK